MPTDSQMENPVNMSGMTPERATQVLILGALVFLVAVRRGFRSVSISDVSGGLVK